MIRVMGEATLESLLAKWRSLEIFVRWFSLQVVLRGGQGIGPADGPDSRRPGGEGARLPW